MSASLILASQVSTAATSAVEATAAALTTDSGGLAAAVASTVASTVPSVIASILPSSVTTTAPVTTSAVSVPASLEMTAAFTGALSGGLAGVAAKFDIVGVMTIALAAGLSGGIIRDLMLQTQGIYALEHPLLLLVVMAGALLAFFFQSAVENVRDNLFLIDALALGLFAVAGADKALLVGLTFVPAVMLGTITSVGGGIVRDMLRNEVPRVLKPGTLNGAAAVLGATTYVTLVTWLHVVKPMAMTACVLLVIALRVLAVKRGWQAPIPRDLTPTVTGLLGATPRDEWGDTEPPEDDDAR
ncbi:MAG: hypothetical protein HGB10_02025 [Coriobacteriia bacterium]|nr:hypothetical protein [Coriobacteriia bacterium]